MRAGRGRIEDSLHFLKGLFVSSTSCQARVAACRRTYLVLRGNSFLPSLFFFFSFYLYFLFCMWLLIVRSPIETALIPQLAPTYIP